MSSCLAILLLALLAEPTPIVLSGTVRTPDGARAAGVEVILAEVGLPPGGPISRNATRRDTSPPVILGRVRADESGEFRLPIASRLDDIYGRYRQKIVWASRDGLGVAFRPIPYYWPKDAEPIRLDLGPPSPIPLRVLGPDGQGIPGARVAPARLRRLLIHREVAETVAVDAGLDGRAVLTAISPADLELIRVTCPAYGSQVVRPSRAEGGERVAQVAPVGRVEGQVKADDPRAVRNLPIRLRTSIDPKANEDGIGGEAEAVTDDQGRFAVPAIAEGALASQVAIHRELPFRTTNLGPLGPTSRPPVGPGGTTRVEIALAPAVLVRGIVREVGTGAPVAGAGVGVNELIGFELLQTDDQGRYAGYAWRERVATFVADPPAGYYDARGTFQYETVPPGAQEHTAKAQELHRGETVRGIVVGADGRAVPGAEVVGSSVSPRQRAMPIRALADRDGVFSVPGVDPAAEVELTARRGERITPLRTATRPGAEPVTLAIAEGHSVDVSGRVVDPEGRPIEGAAVQVTARRLGAPSSNVDGGRITFDDEGRDSIRTGADGRFRTPRILRPDLDYQAEVEADGRLTSRTEWLAPGRSSTFPDIVLVPLITTRIVVGRVVDRAGRPVSGASVSQSGDGPRWTSTVTDAEGRFRLAGVYRGPAILFVAGSGLRFGGHPIGSSDDPVELRAAREADPPGRVYKTLPPVLPRAAEKELARRLIEAEADRITVKDTTSETYTLLDILPRVDPARALDLAERKALADDGMIDEARLNAALGLIDDSPEEASTIAETIAKPALRSRFFRMLGDSAGPSDRARGLDALDKALAHARAEPIPANRLGELGRIGERLLGLGEADRGKSVLLEGLKLAETMPKFDPQAATIESRARGEFSGHLARVDGPAGLAIAREFPSRNPGRYLDAIALAIADRDPAGAEEVLASIVPKVSRDILVDRLAGRMARSDRERARKLVESVDSPVQKAKGLGSMARALATVDPSAASSLLAEAYAGLDSATREGLTRSDGQSAAAALAVAMLPVVERLGDPVALEMDLWRAIAYRAPRPLEVDPTGWSEETLGYLAIGLARYDRGLARLVLEPVARRAGSMKVEQRSPFAPILYTAAAMVDPAWAVELADALPDDVAESKARPRWLARQAIARTLAHGGPKWWAYADERLGRFDADHPRER